MSDATGMTLDELLAAHRKLAEDFYRDREVRILAAREAKAEPAKGLLEQPGDKNYTALVAKADAELAAAIIAERDARIAELERERDRWKFCCEQNALSANNLSAEKLKAEAALAELRGRVEKARPLIEGAKRQAEIAWIDSRDLIEVLALLTEAKEGGGPDSRPDVAPREHIAQPARDTDPVPATDAREAAIRALVMAADAAVNWLHGERSVVVRTNLKAALAAARAAGITGKGTSDE